MSADQCRRAAEVAQRRAEATYRLDEASDAVAALLRAAADVTNGKANALLLLHRANDVAAAYLGEEPQP